FHSTEEKLNNPSLFPIANRNQPPSSNFVSDKLPQVINLTKKTSKASSTIGYPNFYKPIRSQTNESAIGCRQALIRSLICN
ncbi:MAG: hypothetical protein REH83_03920, partial [Rickettsiella sp.]|nr:hypothetical protein [Rickettsiella sp.]